MMKTIDMPYPDAETYKILYSRYFRPERSEQLLDLAGSIEGKVVLDICGGSGEISKKAVEKGAKKVILVDMSKDMISEDVYKNPKIDIRVQTVWSYFNTTPYYRKYGIDIAICQQAINYWFDESIIRELISCMNDGGRFIFNTISTKPPEEVEIRNYVWEGREYVEISQCCGNMIYHAQATKGIPMHATSFEWMPREYLEEVLSEYFDVFVIGEGRGLTFICDLK